jgi:hypothetical protein
MAQKHTYFLLTVLAAGLFLSGCKKFLDVQPEDKYTEEQVYSNEKAVQQALNGLYFSLAANELYGANLTATAVELLGQRYNVVATGSNNYQQVQLYAYTNASVMVQFDALWTTAYTNIAKVNKFLSKLAEAAQNGVINTEHAALLRGEAIGLRAMLHFDLLRLFGPVMATSPTANAIPYYTEANGIARPILPARQTMDSVLADLATAKSLLAADPVLTQGVKVTTDFYSGYRNLRLNYYAVAALQARAYLYNGNPVAANQAAKQALADGEKWFPWLPYADILNNATSPNRIFSTEMLFGIYNQNLYTNYTSFFAPDLTSFSILTAFPARLANIFESNENDYRYSKTTWLAGANGPTFYKYADIQDKSKSWRFVQPLIRKTELYYILAETEPDATIALNYLNTVRFNRGLASLGTAVLATEIQKEYQKEFWGEGQLFFYYKRTNKTSIPSAISGTANVSMTAAKYVVPLPLSETTPR